jgi:hypothetical protein
MHGEIKISYEILISEVEGRKDFEVLGIDGRMGLIYSLRRF